MSRLIRKSSTLSTTRGKIDVAGQWGGASPSPARPRSVRGADKPGRRCSTSLDGSFKSHQIGGRRPSSSALALGSERDRAMTVNYDVRVPPDAQVESRSVIPAPMSTSGIGGYGRGPHAIKLDHVERP